MIEKHENELERELAKGILSKRVKLIVDSSAFFARYYIFSSSKKWAKM